MLLLSRHEIAVLYTWAAGAAIQIASSSPYMG